MSADRSFTPDNGLNVLLLVVDSLFRGTIIDEPG